MDPFETLDATAQAELVRRNEVTLQLVEAAIARIEARNPADNAVIIPLFEDARRAAAAPGLSDGPFRGVPFLLKDIGANQAGLPYYAGSRMLKAAGHRSDEGTVLGARFRAAGFITLGKTNTPELGSCPTTQPLSYGPTNNPSDLWSENSSLGGRLGGTVGLRVAGAALTPCPLSPCAGRGGAEGAALFIPRSGRRPYLPRARLLARAVAPRLPSPRGWSPSPTPTTAAAPRGCRRAGAASWD
ncbi:MAG: amidase family protein [Dehalococcoidia bacterium]